MNERLVSLPTRVDERGCLSFATAGAELPFVARRVFFLFGMHAGIERGGHAHRVQEQFIVCVADSCTIVVEDGNTRSELLLDSPAQALHAPPMHWLTIRPSSSLTVVAVLASDDYRESEYIRDYGEFLRLSQGA